MISAIRLSPGDVQLRFFFIIHSDSQLPPPQPPSVGIDAIRGIARACLLIDVRVEPSAAILPTVFDIILLPSSRVSQLRWCVLLRGAPPAYDPVISCAMDDR